MQFELSRIFSTLQEEFEFTLIFSAYEYLDLLCDIFHRSVGLTHQLFLLDNMCYE